MASWDQDIHRIKEIQELLENRQQYFRGHLNTSFYKLDPNGKPLYFPQLRAPHISSESNDPSLGHSVRATFGSTDTESYDNAMNMRDRDDENEGHSDSSEGNRADHSQNESSSESARKVTDVVGKKKVLKKNAKVVRKWVNKNVEVASSLSPRAPEKTTANITENLDSRKSSILRFKSVSFDDDSAVAVEVKPEPKEVNREHKVLTMPIPLRKKKVQNPIKLLRRRSWILKAEMASRLKEDANDVNFNKVITGLTKASISHAREKLKRAEKSLKAIVRDEYGIPPKPVVEPKPKPKAPQPQIPSPKQKYAKHATVSRLAIRQQEEALKSDLNLREAFALIKIDPDPILKLASVDSETKSTQAPATPKGGPTMEKVIRSGPLAEQKFRRSFAIEDSKTALSLRRLTKLSIQHLHKQHSLIPSAIQPLQTLTDTKEIERKLKNLTDKKGLQSERRGDPSFETTRRKSSSTTSTNSAGIQQYQQPRRLSKNFSNDHNLRAPFTSAKLNQRVERTGSKFGGEQLQGYTLDRLNGIVI